MRLHHLGPLSPFFVMKFAFFSPLWTASTKILGLRPNFEFTRIVYSFHIHLYIVVYQCILVPSTYILASNFTRFRGHAPLDEVGSMEKANGPRWPTSKMSRPNSSRHNGTYYIPTNR